MSKKSIKIILLMVVAILIALFFYFDLNQYFSLDTIKQKQVQFGDFYEQNKILVALIFCAVYIFFTALSLPAASVLTLLGGAIFGFVVGLILVSFSSTIGATLAFLLSRFIFKDWVQKKYGRFLNKLNQGFEQEGAFYLFALRLVPAFPFFLVNILTALLPIKVWTFFWVSQLGMLAGTAVYVFAGTQLGQIESLSGILSPKLLIAFALLGLFPIISKKILNYFRKRSNKNIQDSDQN